MNIYSDLTTREKQVYGALCLNKFCKEKGIIHSTIDELIKHLVSILAIDNLDLWERNGAVLELSGRGDPVPDELYLLLPDQIRDDFCYLVDYVVEIGFVDMYGKNSSDPLKYLLLTQEILNKNRVVLPDVKLILNEIKERKENADAWGEIVSNEEFERILLLFNIFKL